MAKREILAGATDQTIDVFIRDSSSTTGGGLTGLAYNTASLTCYYRKGATGTPTALTLATQTVGGAHSDGGFVAVDGTNCPGQYRLDLSDTIVATAGMTYVYLKGATNMAPCVVEIEVVSVNKFDAVRMGMTALPNAAADAAGGLPISDAGGLDLDAQIGTKINDILTDTGTTLDGKLVTAQADLDILTGTDGVTLATAQANYAPLKPTTAGRTLDVSATGEAGIDWANVGSPTTSLALTGTTIATTQKVDIETIKTNPVVNAGTVTFPTTATLASTTNITGGTITTVTTLTNAPSDSSGTTTLLSRLSSARAGYLDNLSAGAVATASALTTAAADITTILGKFTGITSLAQWLGLLAGSQVGNSTARTELRATGAGGGSFDEMTDSLQAVRDRGDTSWITATGFSTATEMAKVPKSDGTVTWNATALASINAECDTALADYDAPTNAEMVARTLVAADYATATNLGTVDTVVDAIKLKTDNLPSDPADQSLVEAAIDSAEAAILAKLQGLVLEAATIGATGNSTTAIHLPGLTYGDDEIISYLLVIRDVSEDEYHARWITDWVASTALATVATLPFTPQSSTDTYWLLSARADVTGGSGASVTDIRIEMDTNSTKLANLDVTVGSRLASASYTAPDNSTVSTINTKLGTPASSVSADIAAVKTDTGNLVTRITSTLFSGITSMAQWLGLLAGKQVGDTTARTEIRATGAGSGTFDETTDSVQAIRDRGDAAWTTATGFAVPGSEMGLADGAITSAKVGTGAITAAKFAAGAIDAAALNADAVAEIQSGLSTLTQAQVLTKVNEALDTAIAELGIGTPATTPSIRTALMLLYMAKLNDSDDSSTRRRIKNAAGTTIAQATVASSGSGVSQGKLVSP